MKIVAPQSRLGGHVPGDCLIYSVDRHEKSIQLPSNIVSLRHRETLGALLDMRRTKFGRAWTSKKSFPQSASRRLDETELSAKRTCGSKQVAQCVPNGGPSVSVLSH